MSIEHEHVKNTKNTLYGVGFVLFFCPSNANQVFDHEKVIVQFLF